MGAFGSTEACPPQPQVHHLRVSPVNAAAFPLVNAAAISLVKSAAGA
eukprot:CAMPEP_0197669462 /NCGR_PEP_ID=MMETSP1338-20131121/72047_1 /TAXON_ID=43686 ORGANISM="Pelagodinium beii, Strain RCC1491" /NCGR_SAMPLE_ID=MMETSP1338 /ASSEMBLY_ACC=CAM_ASM_000754 /LENGTH=46 /DNA_ID= /DNA_START= /DNA_END= /DNA_ORIENTATION=